MKNIKHTKSRSEGPTFFALLISTEGTNFDAWPDYFILSIDQKILKSLLMNAESVKVYIICGLSGDVINNAHLLMRSNVHTWPNSQIKLYIILRRFSIAKRFILRIEMHKVMTFQKTY